MLALRTALLFLVAGLLEIGGGYLVWLWLRGGRAWVLGALGFVGLAAYGLIPVLQDPQHPFGRVYAAYGAIFILMSAAWGWVIDGQKPDLRDDIGVVLALVGAVVMMSPRR